MKVFAACVVAGGLLLAASISQAATPFALSSASGSAVVLVADGCGPGWYRGPGGACHRFGYGPGPGWWQRRANYCGGHRAWVPGPYGWHWRWIPYC